MAVIHLQQALLARRCVTPVARQACMRAALQFTGQASADTAVHGYCLAVGFPAQCRHCVAVETGLGDAANE